MHVFAAMVNSLKVYEMLQNPKSTKLEETLTKSRIFSVCAPPRYRARAIT